MLDYWSILAALPRPAILMDEAGSVLCWNLMARPYAGGADEVLVSSPAALQQILPNAGSELAQAVVKAVQLGLRTSFQGVGEYKDVLFDVYPSGRHDGLKVALIMWGTPDNELNEGALLSETEQRYRKLVDLLPEGVVIHSRGTVRFVNPAAVRLWHATSRESLEGIDYMAILHPEDRAFVQERIDRIYDRGESSELREYRILPLDGGVVHIEAAGTLIKYKGEPANLVLFRDITTRKMAERQLRSTMLRYRGLFEHSPLPLWEEDWSGVRRHIHESGLNSADEFIAELAVSNDAVLFCASRMRLTDANRACVSFFGASSKNEAMQNMDVLLPEEVSIVRAALIGLLQGQEVVTCEGQTRTISGEERTVIYHFTVSPGCEEGWESILVSVIDLTRQKEAERTLFAVNKMLLQEQAERQELSQRLIEVAENERRGIAMELHDHFGQIMTSLKIDLERVVARTCATDPALASQLGGAVEKTVQTIRDLKRMASGLMPDMIETLGLEAALRDLAVETEVLSGIDIVVFCSSISDRAGLEKQLALYRIAQESLNNVVKHAGATRVHLSLVESPGMMSLSIEDDGRGFVSESRRTSSTTNGLGLSIMRERAAQFGGELIVESKENGGVMILAEVPL